MLFISAVNTISGIKSCVPPQNKGRHPVFAGNLIFFLSDEWREAGTRYLSPGLCRNAAMCVSDRQFFATNACLGARSYD